MTAPRTFHVYCDESCHLESCHLERTKSSRSPRVIGFPQVTNRGFVDAGGLMSYADDRANRYARPVSTSAASSRAKSPPTCPYCSRPSSNW